MVNVKKRLKTLLPTLKEKKRYLVYEIHSKSKIKDFKSVLDEINTNSLAFLGQLGVARAGIQVLPETWNPETQKGIIKVGHKYVDELKASLSLVKNIDNKEVIINTIGVSGIIKKAKETYLKA